MSDWPFGDLKMFGSIVADPPWSFRLYSARGEKKSAQAQYDCMSLDEIIELPVSQLAAPDCCLFLWATWPMLPQTLQVMDRLGFTYKTGGHWAKLTKHGKLAFGTGYRVRCASEPWPLGTIGNPKTSRSERNAITGMVREHSRKPEEPYGWCERYMHEARRVELFSRQARKGWDRWGLETNKFSAVA